MTSGFLFSQAGKGIFAGSFVNRDLLLDLLKQATSHEPEQRFARVCRITQLHPGGLPVSVIGKAELIANKHATGRAQDLADLKRIEAEGV